MRGAGTPFPEPSVFGGLRDLRQQLARHGVTEQATLEGEAHVRIRVGLGGGGERIRFDEPLGDEPAQRRAQLRLVVHGE